MVINNMEKQNALDYQIGGNHYNSSFQPIQLYAKLNFNYFQASILKYVFRYKNKNGKQDLEKAIHIAKLGIELEPNNTSIMCSGINYEYADIAYSFSETNHFDFEFIGLVVRQEFKEIITYVEDLINKEYN